jgi:hypothetical protein
MIGRSFPLGNTWGEDAEAVAEFEGEMFSPFPDYFESENEDTIEESKLLIPKHDEIDTVYHESYGWDGLPMLYTISSLFATTITELKFCGFHGSPIIRRPSSRPDITPGILHHLRYFHNLKHLVLSMYLLRTTLWSREDLIKAWMTDLMIDSTDNLSPSETKRRINQMFALREDEHYASSQGAEAGEMAQEGLVSLSGLGIAHWLYGTISPHLNPKALRNRVNFRASFCIGYDGNEDIFDLDILMDEKGVLFVQGPRPIQNGDKWWAKLTDRRYF